jgi:hypothetical protein
MRDMTLAERAKNLRMGLFGTTFAAVVFAICTGIDFYRVHNWYGFWPTVARLFFLGEEEYLGWRRDDLTVLRLTTLVMLASFVSDMALMKVSWPH